MEKSANQTWGGRFTHGLSDLAQEYTDSQHYDRLLFKQDIRASKAHAAMLARQGIISQTEADQIIKGLDQVLEEISSGKFQWRGELEDVHMNIETRLIELIGDSGKKLHTGRSRNDQVGLTFRLYIVDQCAIWLTRISSLCSELLKLAASNIDTILPGFTHLQPAQPVSLAQHLLAYAGMFRRDYVRVACCLERIKISPLGAAALAGTTYALDPQSVASEVGFKGVYENSMDAVSDRDFVIEVTFCASLIMAHLSRLCEEYVLWANPAFAFITIADEFSTGSSIMPQKKNPDVAELMRGKTGRVYGDLVALLTLIKGLPLTYNRDLQEDKENFFDADLAVASSLEIMASMLATTTFNYENMTHALKKGFLNATELADYLVLKGKPFRDAHHLTGQLVAYAEKQNKSLEDLTLAEFQAVCPLIASDIYPALDYRTAVSRRETPGGTGPNSVKTQIDQLKNWLDSLQF